MTPNAGNRPLITGQDWRLCVDFGTAASKAAIAAQADWAGDAGRRVRPLPLGLHAGHSEPLLVPSAIFVESGRVFFGPVALKRASAAGLDREPLQSFKMLLGAIDLDAVLGSRLKRSIDPKLQLRNRDVLTLYVAYLAALIERCFAKDPDLAVVQPLVKWRYSRPDWRVNSQSKSELITQQVFELGIQLGMSRSTDFLSESGMDIADALQAVGEFKPVVGRVEGSVLEAHAAAAAHVGAARVSSSFVLVFDIGAGTTDFAGFQLGQAPDGKFRMLEIPGARRSIPRAGDEIDTILMNAVLRKARMQKDHPGQRILWRLMSRTVREFKRQVFESESSVFPFEDRKIVLRRKELLSEPMLKSFIASIQTHFEVSLRAVAAAAKAAKSKDISLILAGGGSRLPFIQTMAKEAQQSWRRDARVVVEPLVPLWAESPDFADAASSFPQLEIAIGGASPLLDLTQPMAE